MALLLLPAGSLAQSTTSDRDLDGDGILDVVEDANGNFIFDAGETDWRNADTDNGGEADGSELKGGRDPLNQSDDCTYDQDGDGLTNCEEIAKHTNPRNPDTDGDGLNDRLDPFPLERTFKRDSDGDGIADEWEERHNVEPDDPPEADKDGDGLSTRDEFIQGTDPNVKDTDRDGKEDGKEVTEGTDPEESACLTYRDRGVTLTDLGGHWAEPYVALLTRTFTLPTLDPIIRGYEQADGTAIFLPNREISRFELLKIALYGSCIHLKSGAELAEGMEFRDLPRTERPHESGDTKFRRRVIYTAAQLGIVKGYEDGNFRADYAITRAEALKVLLLASRLELPGDPVVPQFPDVVDGDWFMPYVQQALFHDLIEGYGDGTFRPHNFVTRAEAAKLVHHIMLTNPFVNGYVIPANEESQEKEDSSESSESSVSSVSSLPTEAPSGA